jgi:galactoside O-acetyltransferase
MTSFMSESELEIAGFGSCGHSVKISKRARFYGIARIHISDRVRIDDFAVLSAGSGGISVGQHVHIAVFALLMGEARIELADFSGVSSRAAIYSSSDDFSGKHLTGPTVPVAYTGVISKPVRIGRHAVVGTGATVLPGVEVGDGAAVGAMSLVRSSIPPFEIHAGCPARRVGRRSDAVLELELRLLKGGTADV